MKPRFNPSAVGVDWETWSTPVGCLRMDTGPPAISADASALGSRLLGTIRPGLVDLSANVWHSPGSGSAQRGNTILSSFYQALAPTSFTLLGLWLIVVQTRHAEWRRSAPQRVRAYAVTLNFALPGLMSLLSLVDPNSSATWRVSFAVVAVAGAVVLMVLGRFGCVEGRKNVLPVSAFGMAALLYVLIAVVAIGPKLVSDISVSLTPLRCEAVLLSVLMFLGVNMAWFLMFDEAES